MIVEKFLDKCRFGLLAQVVVVRLTLKKMSPEGTNLATELRAVNVRNASKCVILPDKRTVTTNAVIWEFFVTPFRILSPGSRV